MRLMEMVGVRGRRGDGLLRGWGKRVGEKELGELALAEGDEIWLLGVSLWKIRGDQSNTFVEEPRSDCICRHCPRYIKLSLIFPASCNVAPCVLASLALSLPARSTIVSALPPHCPGILLRRLFLTSTQKKPWLRLDTLFDPVPATRRSCSPASRTIKASFIVPQIIFLNPATTFLSGDCSVGLNKRGRRRNSFVDLFGLAGVSRSKIRSLYTSYIEIRIA